MKYLKLIVIFSVFFSANIFADGHGNGRTLEQEIKCELPNNNVQMLPPLYCKIWGGKRS